MFVKEAPHFVSLNLFAASKPVGFLKILKRLRFSGQLLFTSAKGEQWSFYLYLGQLVYATGGINPVRRWQRNLAVYCPQMATYRWSLSGKLAGSDAVAFSNCWEHQLLCSWVEQQKITRSQAAEMIRAVLIEVLFDIAQAMPVTHTINEENELSTPLVLIDLNEAIAEVQQLCQSWQDAQLVKYSPNNAPIIKQPEELQKRTSSQMYKTLNQVLDGQRTLRDLAMLMKRDVLQVTRSLLPYIQSDLVELISIPDLPTPGAPPDLKTHVLIPQPKSSVIACVDDSPLICQTMESLLVAAGYKFVSVDDPLRAFATLLASKPDLIFLDLVMPNTNGYEICTQLRKISYFRNTPILILTGNDGIVDRVRAKLVGASDFLSKPIEAGTVLSMIRKHLDSGVISN